ncbi:MAG TPA: hypothetical protein VNI58_09335, partial [Mariprofundaceae bacterium]|nr:hypothetical protein [Mariprofundaceae bacterium]
MSDDLTKGTLPEHYYELRQNGFSDPRDENRPNRLCICFSDVHFTDGTVGKQSAEKDSWAVVFDRIKSMCVNDAIEELFIILDGDVADMLRSELWAKKGIYPWERKEKPEEFRQTLGEIMQGIIAKHRDTPGGFFSRLRRLPSDLEEGKRINNKKNYVKRIQVLVLLGNHDKELLADPDMLMTFYKECLGENMGLLTPEYREWIGKMYGKPAEAAANEAPELPFYWGDPGFRLFVTHGQWRDKENSRAIEPVAGKLGWKIGDGWRLDAWQSNSYAPFREPCFGDTVAAGLLSGFIYRTRERFGEIEKKGIQADIKEISRLEIVIAELDLYRPNYLAVERIIRESRRLRLGNQSVEVLNAIESELIHSLELWLDWPFTLKNASFLLSWGLRIAYAIARLIEKLGNGALLRFIAIVLWGKKWWDKLFNSNTPSFGDMQTFPTFTTPYRKFGFRIHGEGHTHIALEADLKFDSPTDRKTYT